ncbi:Sentrin-specific protease 5 [Channa argus]|uniref:Sentrin-specific protease 5 n=1 Tax=Channa argus TaxID=215402 RepID=A0A6G1Q9J8_CHAAH|nr:Sentrin-specific protease 5 [Channa argus]KAK2895550.1 hypothetical protein Q8A73_015038 [Channa argus]
MPSFRGVSHLSRRAKRRLYCKLQLWMWRKRQEKCCFGTFRTRRRACRISLSSVHVLSLKIQSQKTKWKRLTSGVHPPECDTEASENIFRGQNCLKMPCKSDSKVLETLTASSSLQNYVTDTNYDARNICQTVPTATVPRTKTCTQCCEIADSSNPPQTATDSGVCESITQFNVLRKGIPSQKLVPDSPSGQQPVSSYQDQAPHIHSDESINFQTDIGVTAMNKEIHEFLDDFYRIYGSFIPLQKSDVLRHLKKKFNTDVSKRKNLIITEVVRYQTAIIQKPVPSFQVVYKKHTLTLDDLSTLAGQNWLNDQVMNMYGDLIMESAHHEIHFLNSFFHRQLMTKGYDGVKRWTKQVNLFSKSLLLVPIHLEVHWCLVTADFAKKMICLYDSQGNALQKVARNILKYLVTEAKQKQQTAFENGWTVSFDEEIPQQTNENDCGVFVLEYSRCLALSKPLQFSQKDIPKIRKRIYKELCDCKLHEEDLSY